MKTMWISIFLFLAGCAAGWMGMRLFERESRTRRDIVVRTDTVVVTDTVIERMPEPMAMSVVDTLHIPVMDTVLYSVKDTLYVRDTLYVELPREQKFYSADDYRVWVSGYHPRLDSIAVFPSSVYVDREVIRRERMPGRWGLGLHAGYGVGCADGRLKLSPYIGVGISYNLLSW